MDCRISTFKLRCHILQILDQEMIEFKRKSNKKNIILFVHGFRGGSSTWENSSKICFYNYLDDNPFVKDHFDIANFEYFSTLSTILVSASSKISTLKSLFNSIAKKTPKNIGIDELAGLLRAKIRFDLGSYENIIVVAHSMGGLITKQCIIEDYAQNGESRIGLFISLAVPHLGAVLASYGQLVSSNDQIKDLAPLGELCPALNDRWVKLQNKPPIKYFYGVYDDVVLKHSAIGTDNVPQDVIPCDETHTTISKPDSTSATTVTATREFLVEFINKLGSKHFIVKKLEDENQFSDEYFVLKMVLADVHLATINHSKEHFLNAEYTRKLFSSAADQRKLLELYEKIRTLYQGYYDSFVHDESYSSGKLIAEIHQQIVKEDSAFLKTGLPLIHGMHKKGMLHQLANDLSDDVWWSEERSFEALEKIKRALDDEK